MPSDACGGAYSCDPTLPEPGDCQSNQYTLTPLDARFYDLHGNLTAIIAPTVEPPASPAAPDDAPKNRYLSFDPQNAGEPVAFRVEMTANTYFPDAVGMVKWVGNDGDDGAVDGYYPLGSTPVIRVWDEPVIHVYDCAIGPESTFEIRAYNEISISEPFEVNTCARPGVKYWGDCVGSFVEGQWMAPEGNLSMNDLMACLQAFANNPCAPRRMNGWMCITRGPTASLTCPTFCSSSRPSAASRTPTTPARPRHRAERQPPLRHPPGQPARACAPY